jgi:hypothetical protein
MPLERNQIIRLGCWDLSPAVIEFKLIGIASNLNSVAIRVEKTDGAVASDYQNFRAANDGDFSTLKHRIKLVDFLIRSDINAEVM